MSPLLISAVLACVASQAFASNVSVTRSSNGGTFAPGDLIFQDEFDNLDKNKWHHEVTMAGGGVHGDLPIIVFIPIQNNEEFQLYDSKDENAYVRDGILYIKPTLTLDRFNGNYEMLYNGEINLEGCTDPSGCYRKGNYPYILPPAVSARLRTMGTFSFRYGKVVARAKLPSGDWTWPAIWMLPENWVYGEWPYSGEIDIMESRGNKNLRSPGGVHVGAEQMGSTMHFGPGWPHNGWWAAHNTKNTAAGQGFDTDYHIYELEWTPEFIRFSVDGQELKYVNPPAGGFFELGAFDQSLKNPWVGADNFHMAPFDQNFHLILNVAVGGTFFPTDSTPRPPWVNSGNPTFLSFMNAMNDWKPTWTGEEHAMKVDYVRVYAV